MTVYTLNSLAPERQQPGPRALIRAAGLGYDEIDVWGRTLEPEFVAFEVGPSAQRT